MKHNKVITISPTRIVTALIVFLMLVTAGFIVWSRLPALFQREQPGMSAENAARTGLEAFLSVDAKAGQTAWIDSICKLATDAGCKMVTNAYAPMFWPSVEGETDDHPFTDSTSHWAAGITAATAGIFRGLLYFQIIPPGTTTETVVKSIVLLAIAVLPVLVLYPAARISGYYLGWVYKENQKRSAEYDRIREEWMQDFQAAFRTYISDRVNTANVLQKKMIQQAPHLPQLNSPQITVIQPSGDITKYVRQAMEAVCAENSGSDLLNIRPADIQERLESGGILGIKENTLRSTIMRVKAYMLNEILNDLDSSPFQSPKEFCFKLSQKFWREVRPDEISTALLADMQEKYEGSR